MQQDDLFLRKTGFDPLVGRRLRCRKFGQFVWRGGRVRCRDFGIGDPDKSFFSQRFEDRGRSRKPFARNFDRCAEVGIPGFFEVFQQGFVLGFRARQGIQRDVQPFLIADVRMQRNDRLPRLHVAAAERLVLRKTVGFQAGRQRRPQYHSQRTHVIFRQPMPQPQLFRRGDGFRVRDPPDRFDPVERRPLAVQPVDDPGVVFPGSQLDDHPAARHDLPQHRVRDGESHGRRGQRQDHVGVAVGRRGRFVGSFFQRRMFFDKNSVFSGLFPGEAGRRGKFFRRPLRTGRKCKKLLADRKILPIFVNRIAVARVARRETEITMEYECGFLEDGCFKDY